MPVIVIFSDYPMETCYSGNSQADSPTHLLNAPPHLIIPSPSLPNLGSPAQIPMDMSALLAQALYSPFFSMPSLIKNHLSQQPPLSMVDPTFGGGTSTGELFFYFWRLFGFTAGFAIFVRHMLAVFRI